MISTLLGQDFIYDGTSYNVTKLHWIFKWTNHKTSLGVCSYRRNSTKYIGLSKWLIENSKESLSTWRNTVLHEIAHAIDYERRGKSDHSYTWKHIARSIGCDAERTTKVSFDGNAVVSKYTLICDTCGYKKPSHKIKRRKSSCGKCHPRKYDVNFILRQVQNY